MYIVKALSWFKKDSLEYVNKYLSHTKFNNPEDCRKYCERISMQYPSFSFEVVEIGKQYEKKACKRR